MGPEIWFPDDIRNALLAANEGSAQTAVAMVPATAVCGHRLPSAAIITCSVCGQRAYYADAPTLARAFREGYKAALTTVALAFGLAPQMITGRGAAAGGDHPGGHHLGIGEDLARRPQAGPGCGIVEKE